MQALELAGDKSARFKKASIQSRQRGELTSSILSPD